MDVLYLKYLNIQKFAVAPEYRQYMQLDKFYNQQEFTKHISQSGYVRHKFHNKNKQYVEILLFSPNSKIIKETDTFKKLLSGYPKDTQSILIMITKEELNVYRRKTIQSYKHLNVYNYLHKHFIIEANRGPLCSKHTVLTPEETHTVCMHMMRHGHNFPAILEDDTQNIWIGGEINQLIKIESFSEITGKSVRYRIVTPSSGKISQTSTNITEDIETEEMKQKNETEKESENEEYYEEEDYIPSETEELE